MHKFSRVAFVIAAAAIILACALPSISLPGGFGASPTAPATDTALPAATNPALPAATDTAAPTNTPVISSPVPPGTQVDYGTFHIWIPDGLATGTTNTTGTDVEFPYINPSSGQMPQHLKLVLDGYPIQGAVLDPQVMLFPAAEYSKYSDLTAQVISTLQTVPYLNGQPLPPGLPAGAFNAHAGAVTFANGHGIRYLTQFDQAPLPANNRELIYYFHGLTNDGNSYVQAILPLQAQFLPTDQDPNSPLPSGGVPFNMDDLGTYFQNISDKLNATPPGQFTPSLSVLDALLQSISIK